MSETIPESNSPKPAVQEVIQNLATTTPAAELSSSPPVDQEPVATTHITKLESSPAISDPNVDTTFISGSKPVVTESERATEQVILKEQELSPAVVPMVPLEHLSATPPEPTLSACEPETVQVEPASAVTTQEAPKPTPGTVDSVHPENITEPVTVVQPQPIPKDPRPAETTANPAMITTIQSQPKDIKEKAQPSEEPQNKLTQKFTDAEWKALKEFRSQLPDIFAEAYPEQPNARETPIALWSVTLDPSNPQSDARVSVILMKFLRARHLGVREARTMLVNTLRWRDEFDIKAAIAEDFPQEIFGNVGHIYGYDKERRPVIYNIYGGHQDLKAVFGDVNRFLRWRVALMEKTLAEMDFNEVDQTIQIHDYAGVGLSSRDANSKAAANEASNIFQSHYPEFLYRKFFLNVPTVLAWIYWAFKPLVSSETFSKMSVVGTGKSSIRKALLPYIDVDEIPTRYGGEAKGF